MQHSESISGSSSLTGFDNEYVNGFECGKKSYCFSGCVDYARNAHIEES